MDKVGVFIVSKCLSSSAIIDTMLRSGRYAPEFHVVEKQVNPFNKLHAKTHTVVPDLNLQDIAKVARGLKGKISFGLADTEDFVASGGRDVLEKEGVRMICVTRQYAVERSKADQRLLFDKIFKDANPKYKVFDPKDYRDSDSAVTAFQKVASGMNGVVIKPDAPARGAGVGVWGADFTNQIEMVSFFLSVLEKGRVVVEEKVEGEESSFQAFSDGKHFVPCPLARDYKRALDGNQGRLTGGMGSYRGESMGLPFLSLGEYGKLASEEESAFRKWKGRGSAPGLRGVVLYDAIMHTKSGFKILERNSRGGNTEFITALTTMEDDFADVCFRILDGNLKGIRFSNRSAVVTCAVPLEYGTGHDPSPDRAAIRMGQAFTVAESSGGDLRVFPMDVTEMGNETYMGSSRSVAVAGLGSTIEDARVRSISGVALVSGPLKWRRDIASPEDISNSRAHLESLRSGRSS